ncbi:hypothetical protein LTR36_007325 [Oleoguttula mirabilis]|uniref:CCHC-type domain-containing protein n=1 Tax=Oleoguttula mirabilis TaxID=1507867 RepID=A0AAV9JBK9_9PEZI|nr:hypothetical protein LTR36_007325 [Oleoguttula mirabilis]
MGRTRGPYAALSAEEKERRLDLGLCLYCGLSGHIRVDCESRLRQQVQAQQTQNVFRQPRNAHPRPPLQQALPESNPNPNYEPLGPRRRQTTFPPSFALPYDDDTYMEDQPITHPVQQLPSTPKKPTKQPSRAQFITGIFRPNGPARLIHGTEEALTKLASASNFDDLTISQSPLVLSPGASEVVEAVLTSVVHLKSKGCFPTSFTPTDLDRSVAGSKEFLELQNIGMPPFKSLNVSSMLDMLRSASVRNQNETGGQINYALGVLTHQVRGKSTSLRAQLFTKPDSKVRDDPEKVLHVETIWLYRRVEESSADRYIKVWRGFDKRTHQEDAAKILSPLHPVTNGLLLKEGDGYLMSFNFEAT